MLPEHHLAEDSIVFEAAEALKSLELKDGKVRVGAYAIRFATAQEKDLTGDYFTPATDFGPRKGDGTATMFHHGIPIGKGLEGISERTFAPVNTRCDELGLFAECVLDMSDKYEAAIADLCAKGKLKWSSATSPHLLRKALDGQIERWHPIEFSFTPTPVEFRAAAILPLKSLATEFAADLTAALGGPVDSAQSPTAAPTQPPAISFPIMTPEELAAQKAAAEKAQTEAVKSAVKAREIEIEDISATGDQFNCRDAAKSFIRDGKTAEDFRKYVMSDVLKAKPVDLNAGLIGMSDKDVRQFSVLKACRDQATGGLQGLEKEASQAALKALGRDINSKGFLIPEDVLRGMRGSAKGQIMNNASLGGFTMEPQMGPLINLLRNKTRVIEAGATLLGGLTGDVFLPQHLSGAVAYWVSETGTLPDSQSVFGQKKMTPHRLGATIPYSTQFLAQSSLDAESFIRDDAGKATAIEKDRAALLGSGANGEPVGVLNTVGINRTVTYGGAAGWNAVVEHETGITDANADIDSMAFILGVRTVGKWKTKLRDSVAGAGYLIGDTMEANGYPVFRTKQAGNFSFFGVWSQLVIASWSGLEVIVDPFTLATSGQVRITFNELCDIMVRQPLAFNVSTDSAAQ